MPLGGLGHIGEVQRYWEALYAKRPVNLPAFERLVRAHIPRGVPEEWRSVQDYTLQDLKDAVRQAVADDKAPGSNRVTAALIAELPEPVQGLLVHAYTAILRGADVPESWHEAIIWLMPKGTATGNLDEYRPIALGQQDMRMLMTPLMRRFTAVLARKGLAADWQFGAVPGSTAAAPVFLAQRRLHRGPGLAGVDVIGEIVQDYGWELLTNAARSLRVVRWPRLLESLPMTSSGRPILGPASTWDEAKRGLLHCATAQTTWSYRGPVREGTWSGNGGLYPSKTCFRGTFWPYVCGKRMWVQKKTSGAGGMRRQPPSPRQTAVDGTKGGELGDGHPAREGGGCGIQRGRESPDKSGDARVPDVPLAFAAARGRPGSERIGGRREREDVIDVDAEPPPPTTTIGTHLFYSPVPNRGTPDGCGHVGVGKEESSRTGEACGCGCPSGSFPPSGKWVGGLGSACNAVSGMRGYVTCVHVCLGPCRAF